MPDVGGALLSGFMNVLFDKMASREVIDFFQGQKLTDELFKKLKITLLSVNAVLEDAEEKQFTKPNVKEWIDELKDAVYDAQDILDKIATKSLRRKLAAEYQTTASQVQNSISNLFLEKIERKLKEALDRLEYLAKQKDLMGLREDVGGNPSERLPTTSLVEECDIVGRDDDGEAIIDLLLSDDASGNRMSVIALVGMGGIGKTTLSQLVYNDPRVKDHFDLKAWVCVSDKFDICKLTHTILEEVGSLTSGDSKNLNRLQVTLKEYLKGKKFLLVLDDVWHTSYGDWEVLSNPFKSGAQGSRVLVTTRDDTVASVMRASVTHCLQKLAEEYCWELFVRNAFHNGTSNAHPRLEVLGRQIVEKCKGLPLAIKRIGALLSSKSDPDEWGKIVKGELWDLLLDQAGILSALILSYISLPSHLKQCFAYCSIFPKDYIFEKEQLVLLWMAEGFLKESEDKTAEEIGNDYFLALVSKSLFQQSSGSKSRFVMHDLVNYLAKSVSGKFSFRLESVCSQEIVNKARHFSYVRTEFDSFRKFEALQKAKQLRTFLPLGLSQGFVFQLSKRVSLDLLPMLRCLRVLSLSHYKNMTELPKSIGKSKHLRYLDLSFTRIKGLSDSLCKLLNLQTLKLSYCTCLTMLPRDMWKLMNLRHLDITGSALKEMPPQIGKLKSLRTLPKFIINKHDGSYIQELGKLRNLKGQLSIRELQNVVSPKNAMDSRLKDRKDLEELVLGWNSDTLNEERGQRAVLENLHPHTNLKSLTINSYCAESFPDWVGHQSFSNISSLDLKNCKYCHSLPPLGQLQSLQNLSISGFDGIATVGLEFYGNGPSSVKIFGALKALTFQYMLNWEKWFSFGAGNEGEAFPHLETLRIVNCPKLTGGLPINLPSLATLVIDECLQLVASLPRAPSVCDLQLTHCNEVLLDELPTGIQILKIGGFDALESLPEGMIDSYSCLQELEISDCLSLMSLPSGDLLCTLRTLDITRCTNLELPMHQDYPSLERLSFCNCDSLRLLPLDLFPKLVNLEISHCRNLESLTVSEQHEHDLIISKIKILDCISFVSFPKGGLRAPNLVSLWVINCKSLRSLPEKMNMLIPSLHYLYLEECPEVAAFPEGGLPCNLNSLYIDSCDKLVANRLGWGLQKLPSLGRLSIAGKSENVKSFPEAGLLPNSLTFLQIWGFPYMVSLEKNGLHHLISLEELQISHCPKLKKMPEDGLPTSLSVLEINNCPSLKKQWERRKGKEWRKVAHVPCKLIHDELIEGA